MDKIKQAIRFKTYGRSAEKAVKSIENGIEVFMERKRHGIDILGTGDMGIGNTTPSSAVIAAFSGIEVEKVTGRGTRLRRRGRFR